MARKFVVGVDEVGRGPLAGPVVACAVEGDGADEQWLWDQGVADSKKLSPSRRRAILLSLGIEVQTLSVERCYSLDQLRFALGLVDHQTIDRINILQASLLAMGKCVQVLNPPAQALLLVDGNKTLSLCSQYRQEAMVKGDSRNPFIALASIIAKEYRDNLMGEFSQRYPGYGLESHFGYPTKRHREALQRLGPSPIHRRSFNLSF